MYVCPLHECFLWQGSTINIEDMPNTFKSYYFAASSDEETDDRLIITKPKSLKRAASNNSINKFFDEPKTKKPKKGQSSTVGQTREGGMAYISTNTNDAATATHLIKLQVYDLKKLAKVPVNKHWKNADVYVKHYTKTADSVYNHAMDLIYNITKEVAESPDCRKYFFNDEQTMQPPAL